MRLIPLAVALTASAAVASAQSHTLVALSHSDHTVNELDPVTGKILHKFTAVDQPHEGIASPDGKTFYAAVPNGPHVVILETSGFTETGRIESPFFKSSRANGSASPHGIALTGDGSKLYVGLENADIPGIVVSWPHRPPGHPTRGARRNGTGGREANRPRRTRGPRSR